MSQSNDYETGKSNLHLGNLPPPHGFPSDHVPGPQYNITVNRQRTWMRFLGACAVAVLVWIVCATFFRSFASMIHYNPWTGRPSYPLPPDVILDRCVSYSDWSSQPVDQPWQGFPKATVNLDVPLSSEALLLTSRGSRLAGSVEIVTSSEQDQDFATMQVTVSYFKEDIRDQARVCHMHRRDGEGVGIFTPEWPYNKWPIGWKDRLHFATKVILPELSPESSPLLIKKLETDVTNTRHRVGDLNKKVLFQSLILKGSNGRIDVESVHADVGILATSNGGINGIFNTSESLSLVTNNGRVDADIGLSSVNGSEPNLGLITSNGAVSSRISLISDSGLGGSFKAVATTSNGRLDIDFPAAPPYSLLTFGGTTSNARAMVSLNPAYEGSLVLQTSNAKPVVNQDKSVIDPSGRHRSRALNIHKSIGSIVSGEVHWADGTGRDLKPAGLVTLRSSNAQIELNL